MAASGVRAIEAAVDAALRVARSAPSGRLVFARMAEAIDEDWVPARSRAAVAAELERGREAASTPLPAKAVERTLRDAWGSKPTDELDDLDTDPVAVTATAQVHRGTLEGEAVAVKILRTELEPGIRQDFALLDALVRPFSAAFPAVDVVAMLREVRERTLEELDLEHEGDAQRRFHRALRDHRFLSVPRVVSALTHPSVLVSAWAEGEPVDPGARDAAGADSIARRALIFYVGAARFGVVNADPLLEHLRFDADGRLTVVDFGAVRTVPPERVDGALAVIDAFIASNGAELGAALDRLGVLPAADGPEALELARSVLGDLAPPGAARLDAAAVASVITRGLRSLERAVALAPRATAAPEDLLPGRMLGQLFGQLARLGVSADWAALLRAAARDGWDADPDAG